MNVTEALKWTLYYRVLTTVFLLLGVTLLAAGLVLGLGGLTVNALMRDPAAALGGASLLTTLVLAALGIVVWQLGKSYAFVKTMDNVVAASDTSGIDGQALKSEIVAAVDDRLEGAEPGSPATGATGTASATGGASTAGATADAGTAGGPGDAGTTDVPDEAGTAGSSTGSAGSGSAAMGETTTTTADGADDPLAGGDTETEATASEGTPTTSRGRDDDAAVTSSRGSGSRDADDEGDDDDIFS